MVNLNVSKMLSNTANALVKKTREAFHLDISEDNPNGEYPLAELKLDIIGEESLTADSDVTDHFVENNTAYQDQISIKPKIYTVNGEVGELVWYQNDKKEQVFGQVSQRLEGLISFLPIRSKSFNTMKHKAMKALQWVDTASNVASKLTNLYDETAEGKQQQAFLQLCGYRDNRNVLRINTPWGVLKGYVITNLKFTQPKETKDKTLISITFKELRTTHLSFVPFDSDKYQGNAIFENQPLTDNGKTSGSDASIETKNFKEDDVEYAECSLLGDDNNTYSLVYNKQTNELSVFDANDTLNPIQIDKGTTQWYQAIDAGRTQCETEISQWQGYGLEVDK